MVNFELILRIKQTRMKYEETKEQKIQQNSQDKLFGKKYLMQLKSEFQEERRERMRHKQYLSKQAENFPKLMKYINLQIQRAK